MANANEKYFPFRSVSGDRKYSAEDWAAYFAQFIGNGVFYSSADKLKVVINEGMKVKVNKGAAFVNGRGYRLEADKVITLDTADGVLNRIDRIVLRCDYANRLITIAVKKGSYSENPTAPELTRDADVYELALADIWVGAGVVEITTANITDLRLNTALCGIVTGLVEQADTTEIFNQFKEYMKEFEQEAEAEFMEWFEYVKDTLSEDAAGNLQNQITDLQNQTTALQNQTGEISELKTENKTDLVAAVNELVEKEPDLLETMEEVEANLDTGKQVDALVVKELKSNLEGVENRLKTTVTEFTQNPTSLIKYVGVNDISYNDYMATVTITIAASGNVPSWTKIGSVQKPPKQTIYMNNPLDSTVPNVEILNNGNIMARYNGTVACSVAGTVSYVV